MLHVTWIKQSVGVTRIVVKKCIEGTNKDTIITVIITIIIIITDLKWLVSIGNRIGPSKIKD